MFLPALNSCNQLFPFHLVVDQELRLVQAGSALQKAGVEPVVGAAFSDIFAVIRPARTAIDFATFSQAKGQLFLVKGKHLKLQLKGQWLPTATGEQHLFFACTPWISDLSEFTALGLGLQDLAVHDPTVEQLILLRSTQIALSDSRRHSKELKERGRQLEEERRRAEAANAAKSTFLAVMSHEVRTPLNGILGMAGLLLNDSLPAKYRSQVEAISTAGMGRMGLLNDILDLSKIEAGKLEIDDIDFAPSQILEEASAVWRSRIRDMGIEFVLDIDAAVPPALRGDPARLRQIIFNYLSNAAKFTEAGQITLKAEMIADNEGSAMFKVSVTDTGIGIHKEAQGKLFQKFSQAEAHISQQYGGTGLGLSIGKHLAEMMQGAVGMASEPGRGSTFWFTIPCRLGNVSGIFHPQFKWSQGWSVQSPEAPPLNILVADDNQLNQAILAALLARAEHTYEIVSDGKEAVDAVRRGSFDLILMDVQMPVMSGLEATQKIRALAGPAAKTPIVAVTANAMRGDRERYLEAGMNGYVSKPVDPRELFVVINRVLRDCSAVAEAVNERPRPAADKPLEEEQAAVLSKLNENLSGR